MIILQPLYRSTYVTLEELRYFAGAKFYCPCWCQLAHLEQETDAGELNSVIYTLSTPGSFRKTPQNEDDCNRLITTEDIELIELWFYVPLGTK